VNLVRLRDIYKSLLNVMLMLYKNMLEIGISGCYIIVI